MAMSDELEFMTKHLREFAHLPGGIERLRRAILDAALQGKLAPQLRIGETADELLKRIIDAKCSYSAPGKTSRLNKSARGRGRWTNLEELPSGWLWTTIGEITTKIGSGSTPRGGRDSYVSTGPMFLRSQNVWNDGLRLSDVARIPLETHERMAGTRVLPHDILLNITGASIGRAALAPVDIGECNVSQHVMIIRPALAEIAPFLHLYVISPQFRRMIDEVQVGISRDGLSKQSVTAMPVPLPPIREQARIVQQVSSALNLLVRLEQELANEETSRVRLAGSAFRALANREDDMALDILCEMVCTPSDVDELEQAIVELALKGALTKAATDDAGELIAEARSNSLDEPNLVDKNGHRLDDPYKLPDGWHWVVLGSMLTDIQGGWSPAAEARPKEGDEWGVLKVSACSWGQFRASENKALQPGQAPKPELEVRLGDFLISRANTSELVGRSVVVQETANHLMLSDKTLRLSVVKGCNPRYLNLANLGPAARGHYEREATGTSSSMKNVSQKVIRRTPIPLPPHEEQDRIVAVVDELVGLLRRLRLEIAA